MNISYLKQRHIKRETDYVVELTTADIGEIIFNHTEPCHLYLGYPENKEGAWFRIISLSDYDINIYSSTPTNGSSTPIEATPSYFETLTENEDTLIINENDTWHIVPSRYSKYMKIGDVTGGNYMDVDETGFMTFNGDGHSYNDLPPQPIISSRLPTLQMPTLATFVGNIKQYTFDINNHVYNNMEISHDYEEGTDLEVHVHWATNETESVDKYVKWEFEYTIANINGTFSSSATPLQAETLIPAYTDDRKQMYTYLGTIDGSGLKISALIAYDFKRITSDGSAPVSDPFALQIGIHIEQNTLGSRYRLLK